VNAPVAVASHYTPSAWQQEFHDLDVNEALGAGSAGPGKSLCLLMDCNERILAEHRRQMLPPSDPLWVARGESKGWALHLRRTYLMLKQTIARAKVIFTAMDPGVKWVDDGMTAIFTSGYKYEFGHCQKPDDWEKYQSNQYDWIGFDELTQFEKEQYDQIKARCRSSDPVLRRMCWVRSMSNPLMRRTSKEDFVVSDPHWVRKYFVDPEPSGRKKIRKFVKRRNGERIERTRIYLPASLYDNPDPNFVADYEAQLLDQPDHIRAALLHGNWYVTPGSFFGQWWVSRIHECDPFSIPKEWPIFRAMDWGFKSQAVVHWFAVDPEDTLYVIYELNFRLKRAPEAAEMILDVERKLGLPTRQGSVLTGPADDQLWEDKGDSGKSKAEEFAEKGIVWVKANKQRRRRNAELMVGRMKDHNRGQTRPGIVWFSCCKEAIKTIPSIGTDPKDSDCPADGGDDHWLDTDLYGCEYASRERPEVPRKDDEDSVWPTEIEETPRRTSVGGYFR
jgi:hypothetical protein